ncbi:hypothetical protein A2641_02830 [Candidatus Nomurabacteria bacterium RIFCSPHIGHO2_01_FULL_37_25]|uniref:DUF378 domain-containing protein n=1 Tax=Candidatus Nomurabacteria bacterium RIFCSPLOWO2_01_FULL_36_16 TaxID=1801767 RepID=A0A1F6X0U3_9BACT|nr:MAG: hypothetical protein A2641_02830 [Candidatus Nomurabacteria bacterium RIFCSPHIGHO2_01_FULL_37_25]OGI75084.1 MAG: hypothetical protein A3D36_03575 [Candidatus Nomurabacteria bacterium RIFCSPHIGHO2_02_FULL_36_29]OGI87595.1 MAG: hypothetical protein A3A91_01645 [Candidatus Nomurabacteria bacterium RIFCSPLOWO2_01_FULL_36_16]OGI96228.1 MAG: hypothetical protein A3I84_02980 [Candidatus Nomurabacteria bacterium RIFCSPLOWO2_02_FULL_36_8]
MCHSNCNHKWGGCAVSMIAQVLLVAGGLNWGLVGVGMLLNAESWNVVNIALGSMPTLEAVVYLLVGVAAVMSIFGCKCNKCMAECANCVAGGKTGSNM